MDKNNLIVIVAVAILLVAGVGAVFVYGSNSDKDVDMSSNTSDIRLTIYGNANGDDVIDNTDKEIIEKIVSDNIEDWEIDYPYADADQDGKITSADTDVVQKYINKEKVKMYYTNEYGMTMHVQTPVEQNIGIEFAWNVWAIQFIGLYDKITAVTSVIANGFATSFPELSDKTIIGENNSLTIEQIKASGVGAVVFNYNDSNRDYLKSLWNAAESSGLSDDVAFLIIPTTNDDIPVGSLMIGALFNTESSIDKGLKYISWIDGIESKISKNMANIEKEKLTILFCYLNSTNIYISGGGAFEAFNNIADLGEYKTSQHIPTTFEGFLSDAADNLVVYWPTNNQNRDLKTQFAQVLEYLPLDETEQYKNETMYFIDYTVLCNQTMLASYITAAMLYDEIDLNDAMEDLQYFIDNFSFYPDDKASEFAYTLEEILS